MNREEASTQEPMLQGPQMPRRRFDLIDGMILITSIAACYNINLVHSRLDDPFVPGGILSIARLGSTTRLASLWLGVAAFAWLTLRLRRPRPQIVDLASQPGFSACAAGAAILVYRFVNLGVLMAFIGFPDAEELYSWQIRYFGLAGGFAIGCVWLVQAMGRTWRPQPDWLDRTGRAIGALWIIFSLTATSDSTSAHLLIWRERISPDPDAILLKIEPTSRPISVAPSPAGAGNALEPATIPEEPEPSDGVEEQPADPASPPE